MTVAADATVAIAARVSGAASRGGKAAQEAADAALVLDAAGGRATPNLPSGGGGGSGDSGGQGVGGEGGSVPCRLEGRVEEWKPSATANLRSTYRWNDEQKVTKIITKRNEPTIHLFRRVVVWNMF